MFKKIVVWLIVFILIPVCLVALVYGIYGKNRSLKDTNGNITLNPTQGINLLMGWSDSQVTPIKELSWATLKVPLFDSVIIPFSNDSMSFTFENKAYTIKPTNQPLISTWTILVPLEITQDGGTSYNLITAYEKDGTGWTQKQSVFLGNVVKYNSIALGSWSILSVDFLTPEKGKTEIDWNALQLKKYFKVTHGHIAPYYPNINNGLIKDMAIIQNTWIWKETHVLSGATLTPKKAGIFSLRMNEEGKFSSTTDCNNVIGNFIMNDVTVSYADISMTRMACEWDTQQDIFIDYFKKAKSYDYKNNQFIIIDSDGSKVIFDKMEAVKK